jgi:thioredoxin 1
LAIFFLFLLFQACGKAPVVISNSGDYPESVTKLDSANFVKAINVPGLIAMVDFFFSPCDSCKGMDKTVEKLAQNYKEKALIGKANILENNAFFRDSFSIHFNPTFVFFNGGNEARRILGVDKDDSLTAIFDSLLGSQQIVVLDSANFDAAIKVPGLVAMVDFFRPTCPHCQKMDLIVSKLALRYKNKALVGKVNVLQNDSLCNTYTISFIPTFTFLINGTVARDIVGETDEDTLALIIDSLLVKASRK